ncbi:MAG TPA: NUDIX hydrolase [Gammaproteobacteria bacterium]|nr:NUDIX hydrolase [Gammaproteobacteria bacterium]
MRYCSQCAGLIEQRVPPGDERLRYVCTVCSIVHYENPKIVAGCIPVWNDQVLLCRRAITPRRGLWTLPAGFMENDETAIEAAMRETHEEANARVEILGLHTLINLPAVNQVYLMFRARLLDLDFSPGAESLEVALFREDAIPWETLAFGTVRQTLSLFFEDCREGVERFHMGDILDRSSPPRMFRRPE